MARLKHIIGKDSNVICVALAATCVKQCASGLRRAFSDHCNALVPIMLTKFKEKKLNVVNALRDALVAVCVHTLTLDHTTPMFKTALADKNPAVREQTCGVLLDVVAHQTRATLPKQRLKVIAVVVVKAMDDAMPGVRDQAALVLGMLMRVTSEKAMMPLLDALDKTKVWR